MNKIAILFFLIFFCAGVAAQHATTHDNLLWFNYSNTIELTPKWNIVSDVQLRTRQWADRWSQFALRAGAAYNLDHRFSTAAGFTWFGNVRYFNNEPVVPNEWRPWEEISARFRQRRTDVFQRLRFEQRFLQRVADGKRLPQYELRLRLRCRFELGLPRYSDKFELRIGDEVMGNVNYIGDKRFFDQNRTFLVLNTKVTSSLQLQFQYIKIFQWMPAVNTLDNQDVWRFGIQQQLYAHKRK